MVIMLRNNIVKVNIFYLSLDAIVYVESESYPVQRLISIDSIRETLMNVDGICSCSN